MCEKCHKCCKGEDIPCARNKKGCERYASYEKGRADERAKIIKTIIESANHLGYEDIEDLIAYAQEKLSK